jgi:hypothetical protein
MDYVKLARTAIDQFLDGLEKEVNKLLEEKPEEAAEPIDSLYNLKVTTVQSSDGWFSLYCRKSDGKTLRLASAPTKLELIERFNLT